MSKLRKSKLPLTVAASALLATAAAMGGVGAVSAAAAPKAVTTIKIALSTPTPQQATEWQALDSAFEKTHPGIHVELFQEPGSLTAYRAVIGTQLRSGTGPDIVAYSPGPGFIGAFAKAGLVYNLTAAAKRYHWNFFPWTLNPFVTTNGQLDAVPIELDVIGIYYNKSIFAKYGLKPPTSLPNLETEMETLKSHGVAPMVFPDQDGWEGGHLLSMALAATAGPQYLRALESGKASWASPRVVNAINLAFKEFPQKGYMMSGADGINYADGASAFLQGKAAMFPTGEWEEATLSQGAHFQMGYFPFPSPTSQGYWVGGVGTGLFVGAHSKNIPADLTYLNWMTGTYASRFLLGKYQYIPAVRVPTAGLELPSKLWGQIAQDLWSVGYKPSLVAPNIDVTQYASFDTVMWNSLQGVFNGSKTPQQAANALESAFKASHS